MSWGSGRRGEGSLGEYDGNRVVSRVAAGGEEGVGLV